MEFQTNPYLVWQVIPGIITLGIALYIRSRPVKKRESNIFSLLMAGGSLWAFANAVQLITPDIGWQRFWNSVTYAGIMTVPTAWFLLSVKLTGLLRERIEKIEAYFWIPPALLFLLLLTSGFHAWFFTGFDTVAVGGYVALQNRYGPLFYVHTAYSYGLMIAGIVLLTVSLAARFKKYGVQAYGLIVGVLAPLIGNAYFLFGSPPPGFPDPTPIIFTVTGIAFAWAIFGGHILEVVPLAHETIVRKLSTGVMILDAERNIREVNLAALDMLGLPPNTQPDAALSGLGKINSALAATLQGALDSSKQGDQAIQVAFPETRRTFEVHVSHITDKLGDTTGWLVQFSDISGEKLAKEHLAATQQTMKTVLDTLQDSFFEADEHGIVTYANKAFIRTLGFSRWEDVQGKNFRYFTDRRNIRGIYEKFKQLYETGQPLEPFEYHYRTKDGKMYIAETSVSPILDGERVVGSRGIIRDVSVRVQAEEILRQAKEQAESRAGELAAINRLAATVGRSLDLKEILQSVCNELVTIFPIRNAGIGLLTPDRNHLEIVAFQASDAGEKSALGLVLPLEGNTSSLEVIKTKRTVVIQDAQNDQRTSSVADISRQRGTKSIMIVPLLARGEAIGTIGMPARDPGYVFLNDEIELAETIASQIATAVENARLYAKTESALDLAERDLEIGRQIQSGFFPEALPRVPGWEIAADFRAARQVAGDFYDVYQFKNSKDTAFIIADVCDKGVGAALFMVLFRSLLRAFSETYVDSANVGAQLLKIIRNTNDFIAEYHGKSNMFATLFFGILDPESGTMHYVNGGHEPPVILNRKGEVIRRLLPTGPAVGMFPAMEFSVEQAHFDEGDFLVGFTDGTTDAKNASGEPFTEGRLLKDVAAPWSSIFSMLFELNVELKNHIGSQDQFDDITLIAFRRKSGSDGGRHAICRRAELRHLGEFKEFVESAAVHCGLNREDTFAFKLAADELCANIMQYGYEGREPGLLALTFTLEGETARLSIKDDGRHFSPEQARSPDLKADWDERQIGGLGIYFVKELMDSVTYNRTDDGVNQFILEKKVIGIKAT